MSLDVARRPGNGAETADSRPGSGAPPDPFWFELPEAPPDQGFEAAAASPWATATGLSEVPPPARRPVEVRPPAAPVAVRFSALLPPAGGGEFVVTRIKQPKPLPALPDPPAAEPEAAIAPAAAIAIETPPEAIATDPPLEPPAWVEARPAADIPEPAPASAPEPAPVWGWEESWGFEVPRERPRGRRAARRETRSLPRPSVRLVAGLGAAVLAALAVAVVASGTHAAGPRPRHRGAGGRIEPPPSALARRTIPGHYLRLYVRAGAEYGLDWTKLAAVGQIESHSGQSHLAGVSRGTNYAGAEGPAQFLPQTWARFGVAADGSGRLDPYDPANAITAMAAYLKASGAPEDWGRALFTYNHSAAYVSEVLALAARL